MGVYVPIRCLHLAIGLSVRGAHVCGLLLFYVPLKCHVYACWEYEF